MTPKFGRPLRMPGGRCVRVRGRDGTNVDLVGWIAGMRAIPRKLMNGFLSSGFPWLALTARNEFCNPRRSVTLGVRRVLAKTITFSGAALNRIRGEVATDRRQFDKTLV